MLHCHKSESLFYSDNVTYCIFEYQKARNCRDDGRQRQVVAAGDDVKQAALIMLRNCYTAGEAVSSQCVGELSHGSRVVRSIQTDVDVADDENRVVERGDPIEHNVEVVDVGLSDHTGCCGGPRRLPSRRGQGGRGVSLTLTSSALH